MKPYWTKSLNVIFFVGLVFSAAPLWGAVVVDSVVAVVNREIITQSEIDTAAQTLQNEKKGKGLNIDAPGRRPDTERELLSRIIEKKLIIQEARKKGVRLTEPELEVALKDIEGRNQFPSRAAFQQAVMKEGLPWEKYLDDLRDQLTLLKLMNREVEVNILVGPEEVRAYYDAHPEQFKLPDQIRLRQILFRLPNGATGEQIAQVQEKVDRALATAREGEDFGRLAETFSEGAERKRQGDLGYFKKGDLAPDIEKVVFSLPPGGVSPVIRTDLGFHLFKVEEREGERRQPFEKVRQEVEERLLGDKREEARRKWLDEIWARSFVEVK